MNCDWAEKVSALIDGELAAEETRAVEEHMRLCSSCRDAALSFQSLRRELSGFGQTADASTQRRVLAAVLASKRDATRETRDVRGRLAGLLGVRGFAPAMYAAAALLLVAVALGLLAYVNSRRAVTNDNLAARGDAPAAKQDDAQPKTSPTAEEEKRREVIAGGGVEERVEERVEPRREVAVSKRTSKRVVVARGREERRRTMNAPAPDEAVARATTEGNDARGVRPVEGNVNAVGAARADVLDAARHAEQAQMLLRSFRNARLADGGIADERARSKKLLYRNIVLRREAANKRDEAVAQTLERLEPILLDIANLPDDPAEEDVNSIRERMRKKNIVVLLQASAAATNTARKRSY